MTAVQTRAMMESARPAAHRVRAKDGERVRSRGRSPSGSFGEGHVAAGWTRTLRALAVILDGLHVGDAFGRRLKRPISRSRTPGCDTLR